MTISALGNVLSSASVAHVKKTASFLLSRQMLRQDGIQGLFAVMFGEQDETVPAEEMAPLDKLEYVSRLINTVPQGVKQEVYSGANFLHTT